MDISNFYSEYYLPHSTICTDTRSIKEHSLFFALKGANFNGNTFALQALEQGASFSVVDEYIDHPQVIVVEDVLTFLQQLANYHRNQLQIPFIGITGTNGKTTTKELVAAILSKKYIVSYTQGNFNNHIGVPLTILSIPKSTEIAVIEMGANHPHEIAHLCAIAEPDYGIITNVGKAHLEGFGSFENIILTKTEMYTSVANNNGTIFFDADNDILVSHLPKSKTLSYSLIDKTAFVYGKGISNSVCASFLLHKNKESIEINSNLFGEYNTKNMLAAACIGCYFDLPLTLIKDALEEYMPSNNRSQIYKTRSNTLILDAYNANPTSMKAALSHFKTIQSTSKIAVLGEMYELGVDKDEEHSKVQELVFDINCDFTFFVGNWKHVQSDNTFYFASSNELTEYLQKHKLEKYLILIKGSRGVKLETIIEFL